MKKVEGPWRRRCPKTTKRMDMAMCRRFFSFAVIVCLIRCVIIQSMAAAIEDGDGGRRDGALERRGLERRREDERQARTDLENMPKVESLDVGIWKSENRLERKVMENSGSVRRLLEEERDEADKVYGKRRVLKTLKDLYNYVTEGRVGGERKNNGASGGGGGGAMVEMKEIELSQEETSWLDLNVTFWKDLSGKAVSQIASLCIACSDESLYRYVIRDDFVCGAGQKLGRRFQRCGLWRPNREECEKLVKELRQNLEKNKGYFSRPIDKPQPHHSPYVTTFRNAYVSSAGMVYTDDIVFDPRGKCARGSDSAIEPEVARDHHRFKKIYVADHVFAGFHHELAEFGSQLMPIYSQLVEDESIMIHTTGVPSPPPQGRSGVGRNTTQPSPFLKALVEHLGINSSRLVTGDVYAEEVIVVEMSCGFTEWIFKVYGNKLGRLLRSSLDSSSVGAFRSLKEEDIEERKKAMAMAMAEPAPILGEGTILVIKRNGIRRITNHNELVDSLTKRFGGRGSIKKKVEVFDPEIVKDYIQIWGLFRRADLILAPHGDELTNLFVARPGCAVYEFLQPMSLGLDASTLVWSYGEMATMLGLHYYCDFPITASKDKFEFDDVINKWVMNVSGMKVNVTLTGRNVKSIISERGWTSH